MAIKRRGELREREGGVKQWDFGGLLCETCGVGSDRALHGWEEVHGPNNRNTWRCPEHRTLAPLADDIERDLWSRVFAAELKAAQDSGVIVPEYRRRWAAFYADTAVRELRWRVA